MNITFLVFFLILNIVNIRGYYVYSSGYYTSLNRESANNYCNIYHGSELATVTDINQMNIIIAKLQVFHVYQSVYQGEYWIGLKRNPNNINEYIWENNNNDISFVPWLNNSPSNDITKECVQILKDTSYYRGNFFLAANCVNGYRAFGFVCNSNTTTSVVEVYDSLQSFSEPSLTPTQSPLTPTTNPSISTPAPVAASFVSDKYILIKELRTSAEVHEYCNTNYAGMATIANAEDNYEAYVVCTENGEFNQGCYIERAGGYTNWIDNIGIGGDYTCYQAMFWYSEKWNDGIPSWTANTLCNKIPITDTPTKLPNISPSISPSISTPSPVVSSFISDKYIFINEEKTSADAHIYCNENYNGMATVSNSDENYEAWVVCSQNGQREGFISCYIQQSGGYTNWIDNIGIGGDYTYYQSMFWGNEKWNDGIPDWVSYTLCNKLP